jgi:WD repeat-containing protein 68
MEIDQIFMYHNEETNHRPSRQVYKKRLDWQVYAFDIFPIPTEETQIAIGSLNEEVKNQVQIIKFAKDEEFYVSASFEHEFSPTKIMWDPAGDKILATSSDNLKLWNTENDEVRLIHKFQNKSSEYNGPITSFDWSSRDRSKIGVASIDSTCSIYDVVKTQMIKQIMTHNKEVNDIAFSHDPNIFVSVGGDGSLRRFDMRNLEHCSIMFEDTNSSILRVAWNKVDPNYLAFISRESNKISIIDIRSVVPFQELKGHNSYVNSIAWSPEFNCHLCSAGDDNKALIWDLRKSSEEIKQPMMVYDAVSPIINMTWSKHNQWVCIGYDNYIELLKP